jgi:hypothetical protein
MGEWVARVTVGVIRFNRLCAAADVDARGSNEIARYEQKKKDAMKAKKKSNLPLKEACRASSW